MRTLLIEEGSKKRWYPISVDRFKIYVKLDLDIEGADQLRSNIAYNLQYLQFLQKELDELNLSSVLYSMLYKTYVITGMGIVEGLFSNLIRSTGRWNMTEWKSKKLIKSNECKLDGSLVQVRTEIFDKVEKYEMRMDLDSMIKKIESKRLLDIDHSMYPVLKRLRNLRNRIHLQESSGQYDTDYFNFNKAEKDEIGNILHLLLCSEVFCKLPEQADLFGFLKPVE